MSRLTSFLIFFTIAIGTTGLVHYYVWSRLVRDAALAAPLHRALTVAFIALFVLTPLTMVLVRALPRAVATPLALVGFVWLGTLFLLLVLVLASDIVRLLALGGSRLFGSGFDAERRVVLSRVLAGAVTFAAAGLAAFAVRTGYRRFIVKRVSVTLKRLPPALDGVRIAQLTDVHVGPTLGRGFVEQVVQATNALVPDVIAITGDLVDGSVAELREHVAPLAELKARYGVFFVTGNHEYYSGADEWCRELERLGIRVLRNERVSIGEGAASFDLAGVDDYNAHEFGGGHGSNLPKALLGRAAERELVLLAHQPRAIFEAERLGVGLQLSGHTHGGQLWPWNFLVRLQQPVVSGLHQLGQALIYVSNGTGFWGPPMRLGFPAEITDLVLRSKPH